MKPLLGSNGQLFGWNESTWLSLDQWGILLGLVLAIISLIGMLTALIAYIKREQIRRWFTTNRFPNVKDITADEIRWDGIVFTLSQAATPDWVMQTKQPRYVAFLATRETQQKLQNLQQLAIKNGIDPLEPIYLDDPDSPESARREVRHLIKHMRDQGAKTIAVDITGGKKPTSLGAFMAAEESGVSTIYVSTDFDAQLNKPDMRTAQIATISSPE